MTKQRHPLALPRLTLATAIASLLAACSSQGTVYPSLSVGDRGAMSGTMQPAPPAEPQQPEPIRPVADQSISELLDSALAAHRNFMMAAEGARAPIGAARGAERTSDAWATAQVALAGLEAARSQTMIALADLDRRYVNAELDSGSSQDLAATRQEVEELAESQTRMINSLAAELR